MFLFSVLIIQLFSPLHTLLLTAYSLPSIVVALRFFATVPQVQSSNLVLPSGYLLIPNAGFCLLDFFNPFLLTPNS